MIQEAHSPAFKLFNYYYECTIPQNHLYDQDYVSQFGIPTSGDADIDREMARSRVTVRLTIAQMATHLENGAPICLIDQKKSVEIYETIIAHLNNWKRKVTQSPGAIEVPTKDLEELDALAGEVYKIAKGYMEMEITDNPFAQLMARAGYSNPKRQEVIAEEESKLADQHTPISDTISRDVFSRRRKWR